MNDMTEDDLIDPELKPVQELRWRLRWHNSGWSHALLFGVYWLHSEMMVLHLSALSLTLAKEMTAVCNHCGKPCQKEAHYTGEGWHLSHVCDNANCVAWCFSSEGIIDWPYPGMKMNADDLRKQGFRVV